VRRASRDQLAFNFGWRSLVRGEATPRQGGPDGPAGHAAPPPTAKRIAAWLEAKGDPATVLTRAVTIQQPWLRLICEGLKTWEFRHKPHGRPGWTIALHASLGYDKAWREILAEQGLTAEGLGQLGAICAVATLGECLPVGDREGVGGSVLDLKKAHLLPINHPGRPNAASRWTGFAWELLDVRRVEPALPCKGALGFWALREDLREETITRLQV
jgi:hypothetical protein